SFHFLYFINHVLRSFPTRRSSDLKAIETARCPPSPFSEPSFSRDLFVAEFVELCLKIRVGNKNYTPCKPYLRRILCNPSAGLNRSEEHTSEFQSRENLVCRLLLDK